MKSFFPILFLTLLSAGCAKKSEFKKDNKDINLTEKKEIAQKSCEYYKFTPDTAKISIPDFSEDKAFRVGENYVLAGYYESVDGSPGLHDKEGDSGRRLLFIDRNKEILFRSSGAGDLYSYEPTFFKNDINGKIIMICQMSYEYFCGGEAFLIEDNKIKYIGNIDIEPVSFDRSLVDVIKIETVESKTIFRLNSDSVDLSPGTDDILLKNENIRYEYDGKNLRLIR